jgi:hypothetical protein
MPNTFLFRFDGAQENDAFLEQARSKGHLVYAGLAMQLDRGWIGQSGDTVTLVNNNYQSWSGSIR